MEPEHEEPAESQAESGGIARDLERIKSEGGGSVAELREFLGQMRGRTPHEMIGLVANSGLTRSMFLATFMSVIVLAAFTVIPYLLAARNDDRPAPVAEETTAAIEAATAEVDKPRSAEDPAQPAALNSTAEPKLSDVDADLDADRAVDAMGIGETRISDPDENPMEDKLDKLLDGID